MKFIITENILRKLINNMIGYDLSDHIEMITNWYDLDSEGKELFADGRVEFNWLLNNYGPMYLFNIDNKKYLAQPQSEEYGVLVISYEKNRKINEREFLKIIGIDMLGVGLNKIIDDFVEE